MLVCLPFQVKQDDRSGVRMDNVTVYMDTRYVIWTLGNLSPHMVSLNTNLLLGYLALKDFKKKTSIHLFSITLRVVEVLEAEERSFFKKYSFAVLRIFKSGLYLKLAFHYNVANFNQSFRNLVKQNAILCVFIYYHNSNIRIKFIKMNSNWGIGFQTGVIYHSGRRQSNLMT